MKSILTSILLLLSLSISAWAQTPKREVDIRTQMLEKEAERYQELDGDILKIQKYGSNGLDTLISAMAAFAPESGSASSLPTHTYDPNSVMLASSAA